ncbi:ABC transporter permease [Aeoliella mucimassa]|uniref:ABC-2 family transporter protein n=1 Tax=Aeoliella mucimassa TaxID=2527972 RepID=A0A518AR44_9BACT|nr:ABC transporter permease subunit [Aeoliella mucimassa]QDU57198.1 ABC-2 family transporter protein [Aeoliella mucimassa]
MTPTLVLPLGNIQVWLTPVWILSLGITAAAVVLAIAYAIIMATWPAGARRVRQAAGDGILTPLAYVFAAFALLTALAAPSMPWRDALHSLQRLPTKGEHPYQFTVEAGAEDQELPLDIYADELLSYELQADGDLRLSTEAERGYLTPEFKLNGDESYVWNPQKKYPRILQEHVAKLYATNPGDTPVTIDLTFDTDVEMREIHHLPIAFFSVIGIVAFYFLLEVVLPGVSTVAIGTAKEAISQPLFMVLTVLGAVALVLYIVIPYHTFGEDVKLLTDSALTTIMVLGILFALWTASTTVSDEIEGKTALTMLSKPVSRRQFVIGKFVGILWPLLVMFVILGAVMLVTISIKVVYDARESSSPTPDWQLCYETMVSAIPGLVLAFLQAATLASISVAISTRLPMLPNLIIVGAIYVIGNLLPQIVASSAGEIPFVAFTGKLLAVVLPVLNHFNIQPAISAGQPVPYDYLGYATLYCGLYCAATMFLALLMFEDRDLA